MMILITISTALAKAYIDVKRWPFENHWIGFTIAAAIIFSVCWYTCEIYHIFLYNVIFNPAVNLMKGLPIWYIGNTAKPDKIIRYFLGENDGYMWVIINALLLIITIL